MGLRTLALLCSLVGCAPAEPRARREEPRPFDARKLRDTPNEHAAAAPAPARLLDDARIDWNLNPVMKKLGAISASLTESEYQYGLSVNEKRGIYRFDCSGMVHWVLRKSAPRAAWTAAHGLPQRPLARDFQRRLARAPLDRERGGWRRLARVDELRPGDVVAWLKPVEIESPNTGHVAFVLLPPVLAPGYENAYLVRIADSTRLHHDEDTRVGRNGFGFGTILLVSDPVTGA
ncbi:MAG TPA: hypothetical protein VGK73_23700, partial [Polyangiaceae bacterium]